jgi:hypothetical protein
MSEIDLSILSEKEIKNEIFKIQNWIEVEKSNGINIDELLDNSTTIDAFEKYFSNEEFSIFILTVLNNFKSKEIIEMLVKVIQDCKKN